MQDDATAGNKVGNRRDETAGLRWALGYDHAGFRLASQLAEYLTSAQHFVTHFGPLNDLESVDYVPFCIAAATEVAAARADFGIVIGGSGQGEQMAANKVRGIRAALCTDAHFALLARRDNDANVLALPGRMMAKEYAEQIVEIWTDTKFAGGRHLRRLGQIALYEKGELQFPQVGTSRGKEIT